MVQLELSHTYVFPLDIQTLLCKSVWSYSNGFATHNHNLIIFTQTFVIKCVFPELQLKLLKVMAKVRAALVQPFNTLKDSITLIPVHNSAASVGRWSFNGFKAEKHMDQKHPR